MTHKVFAIYDSKAEAHLPPFTSLTTAVAIRQFQATVANLESDFARFPADYTLFELGTWDQLDGQIQMYEAKMNLGTALEHKQAQE